MSYWNEIPLDLAVTIAEGLEYHEDFEMFGQICRNWRQSKFHVLNRPTNRQTPLLMIPEPHPGRFYSLYKRMVLPIQFPPIFSVADRKWWHLSSRGWLISVTDSFDIILFHPFTRRIIQTPQIPNSVKDEVKSLMGEFMMLYFCRCAVLSQSPNDDDCFTLAMVISSYIAIWNSKDDNWVLMELRGKLKLCYIMDLIFYKEELYALLQDGRVVHILTSNVVLDLKCLFYHAAYMVESAGRLLILHRVVHEEFIDDNYDYKTVSFTVWEVNLDIRDFRELQSIGDHTLFVGFNSSFSVEVVSSATDSSGCRPNCIYYTDSSRAGKDMGVYDLVSRKVLEQEIYFQRLMLQIPPLWVEAPK